MSDTMQKVKLGEIATVITKGTTPTSIGFDFAQTGINFIKIESISEEGHFIQSRFAHISKECNDKLKRSQLELNDILFSIAGAIGRVAKVTADILPANTNQALALIRLNPGFYDYDFLCYYLQSQAIAEQYEKRKQGVAQLNISLNDISNFELPIINFELQLNVVKCLNKVTDLIEKRKKQIEKLDELVKSRFIEMFGIYDLSVQQTNWKKISSVAEIVGGSTPKTDNELFWGGDRRWITPAEINSDSFVIYDTERKLTEEGVKSCSLKLLSVGTVLLSSRAPIGKLAIAGVEMYCNQGFKNIICSAALNSVYVYYLLKYNSDYLVSLGRGATFKEISKEIVGNIAIPVPPIELQNKFAEFVEKVEKNKSAIKKSLSSLETLKKSLMQKYFG